MMVGLRSGILTSDLTVMKLDCWPNLFNVDYNYMTNSMQLSFVTSQQCAQCVKKFPSFLEPEGSLPFSEDPAKGPYTVPD
jgi:hypothetical protein